MKCPGQWPSHRCFALRGGLRTGNSFASSIAKGPGVAAGTLGHDVVRQKLAQKAEPPKLKCQTSSERTVWTLAFRLSTEWTPTAPHTPPAHPCATLPRSYCAKRYSLFQYRPGKNPIAYSSPMPKNQPLTVWAGRVNVVGTPVAAST